MFFASARWNSRLVHQLNYISLLKFSLIFLKYTLIMEVVISYNKAMIKIIVQRVKIILKLIVGINHTLSDFCSLGSDIFFLFNKMVNTFWLNFLIQALTKQFFSRALLQANLNLIENNIVLNTILFLMWVKNHLYRSGLRIGGPRPTPSVQASLWELAPFNFLWVKPLAPLILKLLISPDWTRHRSKDRSLVLLVKYMKRRDVFRPCFENKANSLMS